MSNEKRVYSLLKSKKKYLSEEVRMEQIYVPSHIMKTKKFTISIHPISE